MKVKDVEETSSTFAYLLEDEKDGDTTTEEFELFFDSGKLEWVFQGMDCCGKGQRLCEAELRAILKAIKSKKEKK